MIELTDVEDGAEVADVIVRYGNNMRTSKSVILHAKNLGENKDIKIQHLRYKYLNFLKNTIEKGYGNYANIAHASE